MIIAFAGLSLLLAMTPGPDTFLVLRFSLQGSRRGVAAVTGVALGSLLWALAVAAGLASLLEHSAAAYRIVKIAGGLYLIYLGLHILLSRRNTVAPEPAERQARTQSPVAALGSGLFSCALNPKVGLFFLAIVPQFVPPHSSLFTTVLTLGAIDAVIGFALACRSSFHGRARRGVAPSTSRHRCTESGQRGSAYRIRRCDRGQRRITPTR
jgi:threonine/homoserine/homoserine lactone efflux protein